jgi:hypothetical protein
MPVPAHHLILSVTAVLAGSSILVDAVVDAAPRQVASRHGKKRSKAKQPHATDAAPVTASTDADADIDVAATPATHATPAADDASVVAGDDARPAARTARSGGRTTTRSDARTSVRTDARVEALADAHTDAPRVALEDREGSVDRSVEVGEPAAPTGPAPKLARREHPERSEWRVAIGPYLWASAVDANVSLGSSSVAAGVDFIPLSRHAKYGAELLAEVGYGRLSLYTDFMYGVVAVDGMAGIGPVMTGLTGSASSLMIDGAAGYTLAGDDRSLFAFELRGGFRYQRTAVSGALDVEGYSLQMPEQVDAGTDALLGARAFVRPLSWAYLSGMFDVGVFGVSSRTWSGSVDASVRVTSHFLVSLGWRTLTMDRTQVSIVMHGPRAAVQLVF